MLNKRKSPRRKMVLPVKISVGNVTGLAHTIDITPSGARLGGLRTQLEPGTIISLQRGSKKAKFRVEWIRAIASNELQAGIESFGRQDRAAADAEMLALALEATHAFGLTEVEIRTGDVALFIALIICTILYTSTQWIVIGVLPVGEAVIMLLRIAPERLPKLMPWTSFDPVVEAVMVELEMFSVGPTYPKL